MASRKLFPQTTTFKLRDMARAGGGFVDYVWPKPGQGDQSKLSYAEMIPGTDFWIGTGVYIDNLNDFQDF